MGKRISAILISGALLLTAPALRAQGPIKNVLDRFTDPEKGKTVFIEKGSRALGISGGYRSINSGGNNPGEGYSLLYILNIGNGKFAMYSVAPKFSYFVADDLSLGVRLDYDGYRLNTDIRANLGELFDFSGIIGDIGSDDESGITEDDLKDLLNLRLSGRQMVSNFWGVSFSLRKYLSFFGSKTFGVFGEARLYGKYGQIKSCPTDSNNVPKQDRMRVSDVYSTGLKLAAGLAVKLRDNSALTISLPLVGAGYSYTKQAKETKSGTNNAHLSQFNISRELDFLAIQVGYSHYIKSKKR